MLLLAHQLNCYQLMPTEQSTITQLPLSAHMRNRRQLILTQQCIHKFVSSNSHGRCTSDESSKRLPADCQEGVQLCQQCLSALQWLLKAGCRSVEIGCPVGAEVLCVGKVIEYLVLQAL
jgi:hypothetical protein